MSELKGKVAKKETELTHTAIGIFRNDANPEWMVAIVQFNPDTGEAKVTERVNSGGSKDFAVEKFKLEVVNRGLFS